MKNTITINPSTHPELLSVATGETLKVYEVSGSPGMTMPLHYSTEEAVVTVKLGESKLQFPDKEFILHIGDTFLIPAGKLHSMIILEEFKALIVMSMKSEIKFSSINSN